LPAAHNIFKDIPRKERQAEDASYIAMIHILGLGKFGNCAVGGPFRAFPAI
jgi:hypothetical protein